MGQPEPLRDVEADATKAARSADPRVFVRHAEAYLREGLPEKAIQICRDGVAAHPGYALGRLLLARALLVQGALDGAEHECRQLLDQTPEFAPALRLMGEISAKQRRVAASPVARKADAVEHVPQPSGQSLDPLASPTLASLYASQGHADVAKVIYSQIGQGRGQIAPASSSRDIPGQGMPGTSVLEKLLALREAARQLRETGGGPPARSDEGDGG